jgi:(4S)-4-hydroxy-5-phosphonooxypentane-2,3-dione isomerase
MIHVIVRILPKPEKIDAFLELALYDARNSRKEPGCVRFDVLQHKDKPAEYAFYEVYKDDEAVKAHQATPHYARWKSEIEALCQVPRTSEKFTTLDPSPYA